MQLPTNILSDCVDRGSILHSTAFDDIDHGKFFVIIGVSKDYIAGFFFINSRIHPSIFNKAEQLAMQYPLKASDYTFLRYDSFLHASNIIKKKRSDIVDSIAKGSTSYIDSLKQEDLNNVIKMARESKLFSKKDKDNFFY